MTSDEAASLVVEHEGRLCVRLYRRADGTLITRDCPVGLRSVRRRLARTVAAMGTLLAGIFCGAWAAQAAKSPRANKPPRPARGPLAKFAEWMEPQETVTMGEICIPPNSLPTLPLPPTPPSDPGAELPDAGQP